MSPATMERWNPGLDGGAKPTFDQSSGFGDHQRGGDERAAVSLEEGDARLVVRVGLIGRRQGSRWCRPAGSAAESLGQHVLIVSRPATVGGSTQRHEAKGPSRGERLGQNLVGQGFRFDAPLGGGVGHAARG